MAENIRGDLVSEKGREVTFDTKTSIPCPSCNNQETYEDRVLYVRSNIENSVTLECPNCAYTVHRPAGEIPELRSRMTDIKGRPIK